MCFFERIFGHCKYGGLCRYRHGSIKYVPKPPAPIVINHDKEWKRLLAHQESKPVITEKEMLKKLKEMPPGDIRDLPTPKERPSINGKRREEEGKKWVVWEGKGLSRLLQPKEDGLSAGIAAPPPQATPKQRSGNICRVHLLWDWWHSSLRDFRDANP